MTTQTPQDKRVPAHTRRTRPVTGQIDLIIIHATRGDAPATAQFAATTNWFGAAPDMGGWGPTADALAGAKGEKAVFTRAGGASEYRTRHGSFSAGYGGKGASQEFSADERGYAIEIAQSASLEAYTDAAIAAAADLARPIVQAHNIPLVRVSYWSQLRSEAVPRGFIGHEDTANGRKTGKSDPGPKFPWARFFELIGSPSAGQTYTVRAGDTLGAIAIRYAVTVANLVKWNALANPNVIEIGQVLRVVAPTTATPPPPAPPPPPPLPVIDRAAMQSAIDAALAAVATAEQRAQEAQQRAQDAAARANEARVAVVAARGHAERAKQLLK